MWSSDWEPSMKSGNWPADSREGGRAHPNVLVPSSTVAAGIVG